jgi:pSer/pThr/pTyr-binding forkhead associated (FHA) protein
MRVAETTRQDGQAQPEVDFGPLVDAQVTAGDGTPEQKSWSLVRPVTLIGFSQHSHIRVDALGVESVHAALLNTGDAVVLADLASRQGIYCGTQRIRTRVMRSGETFRLGGCLLRLDIESGHGGGSLDASQVIRMPQPVRLKAVRGGAMDWTTDVIGAVIGSRPGCSVRLDSREVWPLHAILTRVGRQVVVASLAADKSIRVNDKPVNAAPLASGDTLTVWPIALQVTIGQERTVRPDSTVAAEEPQEQKPMTNVQRAEGLPSQAGPAAQAGGPPPSVEAPPPAAPALSLPSGPAVVPPGPAGEIPQLGSRLVQMEEELLNSSRQLRQWQQQLELYANGLIRRDAELTQRASQLDQLQNTLLESQARIQKRSEEMNQARIELQAQIERREAETAADRQQLALRAGQLDALQEELKQREERLRQQYAEFQRKHDHLTGQIEDFEAQQAELQARLDAFEPQRQEICRQAERAEQTKRELEELAKTLEAAKEDLARREAQMAERLQVIDRFRQVLADAWVHFGSWIEESKKTPPAARPDIGAARQPSTQELQDGENTGNGKKKRGWW